ncbi:MAG TPA: histidine phosphotransferase family protein [Alphaproteobacteria bacterium]|nr:histidine phosphotransferase family protein [Alphaproteobacteria bacterium]
MTELQLAELMAARLCHDLVGPIGAVANGIELLGDGGAGPDPEVTGLIALSARQATRRLQWFRVAFGSASGLPSAAMFGETRKLASGLFEDGRVALDWADPDPATEAIATREAAKFALNMSLVALECLPRGGSVQVRIMPSRNSVKISVAAIGATARVPDDMQQALRPDAPIVELTPKSVPAYLAARLAYHAGSRLDVRMPADDRVEFAADLPARS